ncbi:acyltransferase family protein [Tundrisphaera sp. TA3]|uniref:acyltransferase family protein n=1 Tax=Tundrisphaera sp. TA3 TaxID=3435775 RepID=UPI003EBECC09
MESEQPETNVAPARSGPRYEMLDVWRGLVAMLVVAEHAGVVLWGYNSYSTGWEQAWTSTLASALRLDFGGLLFFVMSGFCIASSLDSARRRGDSPLRFLYRRFWRIFPTYWAALFVFVAFVAGADAVGLGMLHNNGVSLELSPPGAITGSQWLGNLTLTETWRPHVLGEKVSHVYTRVAWSLCYQEQFYLACMLLLWLVPGRLAKGLAALTVLFLGFRFVVSDLGWVDAWSGTLLYYWDVFAIGLAVHWRLLGSEGCSSGARRSAEVGLAAGAIATWACWQSAAGVMPYLFGLALILLHRWDDRASALAWLRPIRAIGKRSYSIYLIHLPVTNIGNGLLVHAGITPAWARALVILPVVFAASLAAGWAFHAIVERHFLGLPPRIRWKPPGMLPPGGGLLGLDRRATAQPA